MFFAILLTREAEQDTEDPALLNLARILAIVQLAGMLAIMVGLLIDGKMQRFVGAKVHSDWAANNVFFFGAMALALISWMAIKANRRFQNDTNKM
jgi:nitric oxide reductase large subunit